MEDIMENEGSIQSEQQEPDISYASDTASPAAEESFGDCEAPTTFLENREPSICDEPPRHNYIEESCMSSDSSINESCSSAREPQENQIKTPNEASKRKMKKKKRRLRNLMLKLKKETEQTETGVLNLQGRHSKVQEKAVGVTEKVTVLFRDIRRRLDDLEKRVLSEVSRQTEQISLSYDRLIQQLEIKKDELLKKISHLEELCHSNDPLAVFQEPDKGVLGDTKGHDDKQLCDGGDVDVALISHTLHTGLSDIITGMNRGIYVHPADVLLDANTASLMLLVSDDRKTISSTFSNRNLPKSTERFKFPPQVLSVRSFLSGRHYWDVEIEGKDMALWSVGVSYSSIERKGEQSQIGHNNKSWGLHHAHNAFLAEHNRKKICIPGRWTSKKVRIYLDYEAGQLSFYDLCDPIRHIHTFAATFTEPLHAALCMALFGSMTVSGCSQEI